MPAIDRPWQVRHRIAGALIFDRLRRPAYELAKSHRSDARRAKRHDAARFPLTIRIVTGRENLRHGAAKRVAGKDDVVAPGNCCRDQRPKIDATLRKSCMAIADAEMPHRPCVEIAPPVRQTSWLRPAAGDNRFIAPAAHDQRSVVCNQEAWLGVVSFLRVGREPGVGNHVNSLDQLASKSRRVSQ